jgi:hypothetical protein
MSGRSALKIWSTGRGSHGSNFDALGERVLDGAHDFDNLARWGLAFLVGTYGTVQISSDPFTNPESQLEQDENPSSSLARGATPVKPASDNSAQAEGSSPFLERAVT